MSNRRRPPSRRQASKRPNASSRNSARGQGPSTVRRKQDQAERPGGDGKGRARPSWAGRKPSDRTISAPKQVEVDITALGGRGDAIARMESGEVVLLTGGTPGDRVRVQLQGRKSNVKRGKITTVLRAGPHRATPPCPVADVCGGCTWQHVTPERQRFEKARNAARAVGVAPLGMGTLQSLGWRRRARFHLRLRDGELSAGFMAQASDALVAASSCPVLEPPLDVLPGKVAKWAAPWLARGEGLAHLGAEGVILRVQGKASGAIPEITSDDAARLGVVGLEVAVDNVVRRWGLTEVLLRETVDNDPVHVDAGGFSQASAEANLGIRAAVEAALAQLGHLDGARELYAGSGNLTGLLLRAAPRVMTIERNAAATARARLTYGDADGRLDIRTGDANDPGSEPTGREVWLLDPGRPGAKLTCERMTTLRPAAIIYVSCAPDTLRRDLQLLKAGGYTTEAAWWVDTFPHTPHLELIVLLTLG